MDEPSPTRPEFKDITLFDQDTGEPFTFTAKEQEFFWRQGFTHVPKRTPERRKAMREERTKGKPISNVSCKVCGRVGQLTQELALPKEVYCERCFFEVWEEYLSGHPDIRKEHEAFDNVKAAQG
jgi:hypothetical protein